MKKETPDAVQDETKSEPEQEWRAHTRAALYDPETDLNKLALHMDSYEDHGRVDKLMNKMHSLGQMEGDYVVTESLPLLNQKLNSSNSELKKTGTLFVLCQNLLEGLQRDQFGENFHPVLVNLIFNGIADMLARFLNAKVVIGIRITTLNQNLIHTFLNIRENFIEFTHLNFDDKKIETLPTGEPINIRDLMLVDKASIYLEDIKKVISKLLPLIPYRILVSSYISPFLRIQALLNKEEAKTQPASNPGYKKEIHYDVSVNFFKAMKEPLLALKKDILMIERTTLFKGFDKLPPVLLDIIHHYADTRALCFFDNDRKPELVNDHFSPETPVNTPS